MNGLRCDPSKLLLDPYAKAIEGQLKDSSPSSPTVPTTLSS